MPNFAIAITCSALLTTENVLGAARSATVTSLGGTWSLPLDMPLWGAGLTRSSEAIGTYLGVPESTDVGIGQLLNEKINAQLRYAYVEPRRGALDLLEACASLDVPVAIVSNLSHAQLTSALATTELTRYATTLASVNTERSPMPAPDIVLHAARRIGVTPRNLVVISDHQPGVDAAIAAEAQAYALGSLTSISGAHFQIGSLWPLDLVTLEDTVHSR